MRWVLDFLVRDIIAQPNIITLRLLQPLPICLRSATEDTGQSASSRCRRIRERRCRRGVVIGNVRASRLRAGPRPLTAFIGAALAGAALRSAP